MSSLALYRRYRPESFAEVIGQEHVTVPLQQALRNDRVNHAYLFSGPRGCGKTTSARILARCLNCERGPAPAPCGECRSCRDLARNGPGSIDVIEIDAASHGGVDDARDLREKAFFGPAASRFKIYIIDEAHMVTPAGFNALLKVVEEPPEHLKFIFATTEPDKVIGTIRSRTHHYPFRLVPPGTLRDYLAEVCGREQIPVAETVLPLVVRAGGGSVRDSMSVMDQLLAGADGDGVTYEMATALLGYTDAALLDTVIDALAAGDGAAAFGVVDRVIEGGHDPRRFAADLLERLRDLVILAAVPDAAEKGLITAPADVLERMRAQASTLGPAELSRAADLVNAGLTEMRGATSPRLHLELICARVLLPAAYGDESAVLSRLDRLERHGAAATPPVGSAGPGAGVPAVAPASPPPPAASAGPGPGGAGGGPGGRVPGAWPGGAPTPSQTPQPQGPQPQTPARAGQPQGPQAADPAQVRNAWPGILEHVKKLRRYSWILLSQNAQIAGFDGSTLRLGFVSPGARDNFLNSGSEDVLRQAVAETMGVRWRIEAVVDAGGGSPPGGPGGPTGPTGPGGGTGPRPPGPPGQTPPVPRPAAPPAAGPPGGGVSPASAAPAAAPFGPAEWDEPAEPAEPDARDEPDMDTPGPGPVRSTARSTAGATAGSAAGRGRSTGGGSTGGAAALTGAALTGAELIVRELGATLIEEFRHE